MNDTSVVSSTPANQDMVGYTQIIYALHAASVVIGILSSAFIVTAFVFGIPSIVAVIMNYARRSAVAGTWLESHFKWQIRTFWITALTAVVIAIICAPFVILFGLGILMAVLGFGLLGLWVGYRVVRGWLALRDSRPMYTLRALLLIGVLALAACGQKGALYLPDEPDAVLVTPTSPASVVPPAPTQEADTTEPQAGRTRPSR